MLGGLQSRSERSGEEKNSQPLSGLEPLIIQAVTQRYTAEISWLLSVPKEFELTDGWRRWSFITRQLTTPSN
jgi:hypothetical protein